MFSYRGSASALHCCCCCTKLGQIAVTGTDCVLPATTASFRYCEIIFFPRVPHLIGTGVNINRVNIVSNLRHLAGQRVASSQRPAPRRQSRNGLMDMLVFVQDSSNCTTSDPFKIFKCRLKERRRDPVSKAAVGKGCCPWPELDLTVRWDVGRRAHLHAAIYICHYR